jgi:hypothetical protein
MPLMKTNVTFQNSYFHRTSFLYRLSVERIDAAVDFAWGTAAILSSHNDAVAVRLLSCLFKLL